MNIIPMIGYKQPLKNTIESRRAVPLAAEHLRTRGERLWLAVKWKKTGAESNNTHVTHGRVIIAATQDFCAGAHVNSPQINTFNSNGWGHSTFAPAASSVLSPPWARLDAHPELLPDLNVILGVDSLTERDVREWMNYQIAGNIMAWMRNTNRRSLTATDNCYSEAAMNVTVRTMQKIADQHIPVPLQPAWVNTVDSIRGADNKVTYSIAATPTTDRLTMSMAQNTSPPFLNINSSRVVQVHNMVFDWERDHSLDEIDEDEDVRDSDTGELVYDDHDPNAYHTILREDNEAEIVRCYANQDYLLLAPNQYWRNG